jgi:hypothetical protein
MLENRVLKANRIQIQCFLILFFFLNLEKFRNRTKLKAALNIFVPYQSDYFLSFSVLYFRLQDCIIVVPQNKIK